MKYALAALLMLTAAPAAIAAENVTAIPYDSDVNYLKMPDNMYLGEVSGVAVNSKGHIFVFHRGNTDGPAYGGRAAQLLEFDETGKYVREIGTTSTPGRLPIRSASTRTTMSGSPIRAPTW
jgi:hypothetical protein